MKVPKSEVALLMSLKLMERGAQMTTDSALVGV